MSDEPGFFHFYKRDYESQYPPRELELPAKIHGPAVPTLLNAMNEAMADINPWSAQMVAYPPLAEDLQPRPSVSWVVRSAHNFGSIVKYYHIYSTGQHLACVSMECALRSRLCTWDAIFLCLPIRSRWCCICYPYMYGWNLFISGWIFQWIKGFWQVWAYAICVCAMCGCRGPRWGFLLDGFFSSRQGINLLVVCAQHFSFKVM